MHLHKTHTNMKRFFAAAALAFICFAGLAQNKEWAVVTFSANFMREEPSYAAENGNQALMGTVVKVLEKSSYWYKVESPEPYTAWCTERGLVFMTEKEKDAYIAAPKFICTAEYTHVYSDAGAKSERVSDLVAGDLLLKKDGYKWGWFQVALPSGELGWVAKEDVEDFQTWAETRTLTGESIVGMAKNCMGTPYLWGGTSLKNMDCSGFSRTIYFLHGILLPRNASQQAKVGVEIPTLKEAQPGDLIFYGRAADGNRPERVTHVTIYMGEGQIIHSASNVHCNSIIPGTDNYYGGTRLHIRRILGNEDNGTGIISTRKSPYYFPQK